MTKKMDALSYATQEIAKADKEAISRDKETAKIITTGGVEGLKKFCDLIRTDIAGFEEQVWQGRKDANDIARDELIAMRAYALRVIARAEFYINLVEKTETAPATGASEKITRE